MYLQNHSLIKRRVGFPSSALLVMVLGAWLCMASAAQGAIINLQAYVLYSLYQADGLTPLPDGSLVQIIGSLDNAIDPMGTYGTNVTGQTTGDDVILGSVQINSADLSIDGTFYSGDIYFLSEDIKYMYIRFYDTTNALAGLIYWGESDLFVATNHAFNVLEMDFGGSYSTTNQNNFVAIPEPGTLPLLLLALGALALFHLTGRFQIQPDSARPHRRDSATSKAK